jgi:hypothetical protein
MGVYQQTVRGYKIERIQMFPLQNDETAHISSLLKGTVARDFLPLVFSTNRPHICSPRIHTQNIFEFFCEFAEIFVFECCSAGFDSPQDFVPRGLIPRRTLFTRVSDPAGHCSARYQTPQNKCIL